MDLILHKKLMALQLENNELRKQLEQLQEAAKTKPAAKKPKEKPPTSVERAAMGGGSGTAIAQAGAGKGGSAARQVGADSTATVKRMASTSQGRAALKRFGKK